MNNVQKAEIFFKEGYACSQSILLAFSDEVGIDAETAKRISATFGGGMGRLRKTCGALTGSFMVLGLKYGNVDPKDMDTKLASYEKVRLLAKQFEEIYEVTDCADILRKHASRQQIEKREHHRKICDDVVRDCARLLSEIINSQERQSGQKDG